MSSSRGGKFLTFCLGREEYGIGILKVREIIGLMDITAVMLRTVVTPMLRRAS